MNSAADALLYGDYRLVTPDTLELFSRTGLIHLLSASGFHMGVAYGLGHLLLRLIPHNWRRPPWDALIELIFSALIMILLANTAGWGKPVVRAFTLQLLWLLARVFELSPRTPWIFAISLTVSFHWGGGSFTSFLLSALSMLALLIVREQRDWRKHRALEFVLYLTAPWIATLPVTVFLFHSAALLAPLYNLIFAPLFGFFTVLPLIISIIFKAIGLPLLAAELHGLAEQATHLLLLFLAKAEALIGGGMSVSSGVFFLFLFLLPTLLLHSIKKKFTYSMAVIALFFASSSRSSALFLDVGQGDAILLQSKNTTLLMDTGRPDGKVVRELARANTAALDHLFLTHPDNDHTGGVSKVLARLPVRTAWISPAHLEFKKILPTLSALEKHQVPIRFWTLRSPLQEMQCAPGPGGDANDTSPLCRFNTADGQRVLLTGDLSGKAERWFLSRHRELLRAEVLKAGHHGSRFSSTAPFLDAVKPREAVISVGRNHYGHPHRDVLARLKARNITVWRTDERGRIPIN